MLAIHLPAGLLPFWHWLLLHWPAAPKGCRWQFGHAPGRINHWQKFCRTS